MLIVLCILLQSLTSMHPEHKKALWQERKYLDSLTEASLTDAAQSVQLEAVCSHQQVLRHGTVQINAFQLLHHQHICFLF